MTEKLGLSPQYIKMLRRSANGRTNKEIARELDISNRTVDSHRNMILRRLNAKNIAHAVAIALSTKLIEPNEIEPTSPEAKSAHRAEDKRTKVRRLLMQLIDLIDNTQFDLSVSEHSIDIASTSDEPMTTSQVGDHQTRMQ